MNKLYEILEVCLQDIEQGVDMETVLFRYPDLADELRPILEASVQAKNMAVSAPSAEVLRRNRARVLQRAAQMREAKSARSVQRNWFMAFRRVAVTLVVLLMAFASGTGLVRASSTTLPGDNLYPVKRGWEDVRLFFTFDTQTRNALISKQENERLDELDKLFASGRSAKVDFTGVVTNQNGDGWRVSGVLVIVSAETNLPSQTVEAGAAVRVQGSTRGNGVVLADSIELLPSGSPLPNAEDNPFTIEEKTPSAVIHESTATPSPRSGNEAPINEETKTANSEFQPVAVSFDGDLFSMDKDVWTVNGLAVNIRDAEIKGIPVIGASVKVEGYYDSLGVFIGTKIEIIANNSNGGNGSGSNANDTNTTNTNNDNGNDDNSRGGNSNEHGGNNNGSDDNGNSGGGNGNDKGGGG